MKIFHSTAEYFPFIKVGGLSDMLSSFSRFQAKENEVSVALPLLSHMEDRISFSGKEFKCIRQSDNYGSDASMILSKSRFLHTRLHGVDIYFFQSPIFQKYSSIYGNSDELFSFAIFSYACHHLSILLKADIIHAHDWHTSLSIYLSAKSGNPKSKVFTIHNLAYQGDHPYWMTQFLRLDPFYIRMESLDNLGKVNYMKGAILSADEITTVSPGYREEVLSEPAGCHLAWLLNDRKDSFTGIMNGIDEHEWNPEVDSKIFLNYNKDTAEQGKYENKLRLYHEQGLHVDMERPMVGIVSRLTYQKGFETFLDAFVNRIHLPFYYFVLGTGDENLEEAFFYHSHHNQQKLYFFKGFNETLARKIEAASDFFLMPSLFEPCGLNQLYSHAYGSIPIVSRVGGLKDSVHESDLIEYKTGFVFEPNDSSSLGYALERASSTYYNKNEFNQIRKNIMSLDWGWKKSTEKYHELYARSMKGII
ncbi:MAG: glycogen/starch synthase [Leptospiraceae bacterium]|nr:glycogen/starch synthase [Leptospiraceae bacterium]